MKKYFLSILLMMLGLSMWAQNVSMYAGTDAEPFWTGESLEAAVANIPSDTTNVRMVVNANISTTEKFRIPNGSEVILTAANSDVTVSLNQDIMVTGAAKLTIHDITLTATTASPNNYTYDGLICIYNGTLKITGNTIVDASAAYINGIAADGSNYSHLTISGDGNIIKGCMLTSGGNVNRRGLTLANNQVDVSLKSGTYMGHDGALFVTGGKILDVLGDHRTYFEADSTSSYQADYDDDHIDSTVIVKEGYPYTCKLSENGNVIYYSAFKDAWNYAKGGSNKSFTLSLFSDEFTYYSWGVAPTWSGSNHLTVDGHGNTLWLDGTLFVKGRLTLRNVTCRPGSTQSYFGESTGMVTIQQNGHLTIDGANIMVLDEDYFGHFSLDAIKIEGSSPSSLIVKSGIIQGASDEGDAKRALVVANPAATIRLIGGTFSGHDGAMYLSQPSSGTLHASDLLAPGCAYFSDEAQTTFFNSGNYAVSQIGSSVTVGGYYQLEMLTSGWTTLCLPFVASLPEGVQAYYVSDTTSGHLTLKLVGDVLPAGEGMIIRASRDTYTFRPTDAEAPSFTNYLSGTLVETALNRGENYVMSAIINDSPVFRPYGDAADQALFGTISLSALKAYLPGDNHPSTAGTDVPCVIDEGSPTDIDTAAANASATKTFINGQLVILRDGGLYSITGLKMY